MTSKPNFLKVIILGDGAVGKSALMNRFVNNKFDSQSFHTIGVEFLNKEVTVNNEEYTLQIWDTAGQERFKSLRTPFYRGSDICLLVYSVDDEQSFHNLDIWKREFLYHADIKDPDSFPFVLLGNKSDIGKSNYEVNLEEVQNWCKANGNITHFETSAKASTNVEAAFSESVNRWLTIEKNLDNKMRASPRDYSTKVDLNKQRQNASQEGKNGKGCCD